MPESLVRVPRHHSVPSQDCWVSGAYDGNEFSPMEYIALRVRFGHAAACLKDGVFTIRGLTDGGFTDVLFTTTCFHNWQMMV